MVASRPPPQAASHSYSVGPTNLPTCTVFDPKAATCGGFWDSAAAALALALVRWPQRVDCASDCASKKVDRLFTVTVHRSLE
jgi:hypothetical protein